MVAFGWNPIPCMCACLHSSTVYESDHSLILYTTDYMGGKNCVNVRISSLSSLFHICAHMDNPSTHLILYSLPFTLLADSHTCNSWFESQSCESVCVWITSPLSFSAHRQMCGLSSCHYNSVALPLEEQFIKRCSIFLSGVVFLNCLEKPNPPLLCCARMNVLNICV